MLATACNIRETLATTCKMTLRSSWQWLVQIYHLCHCARPRLVVQLLLLGLYYVLGCPFLVVDTARRICRPGTDRRSPDDPGQMTILEENHVEKTLRENVACVKIMFTKCSPNADQTARQPVIVFERNRKLLFLSRTFVTSRLIARKYYSVRSWSFAPFLWCYSLFYCKCVSLWTTANGEIHTH